MLRILRAFLRVTRRGVAQDGTIALNSATEFHENFWIWVGVTSPFLLFGIIVLSKFGWTWPLLGMAAAIATAIAVVMTEPWLLFSLFIGTEAAKKLFGLQGAEGKVVEVVTRSAWYLLVIAETIILFGVLTPIGQYPKVFLVGALALAGVMVPLYRLFPKVFPGHWGKKILHLGGVLILAAAIAMIVVLAIPKAYWHDHVGFYPLAWFNVSKSSVTAQEARDLLEEADDAAVEKTAKEIKEKITTAKPLAEWERKFLKYQGEESGVLGTKQKLMLIPFGSGEYRSITLHGQDHNWMALDNKICVSRQFDEDTDSQVWVCPTGVAAPDGKTAIRDAKDARSIKETKLRASGKEPQWIIVGYTPMK